MTVAEDLRTRVDSIRRRVAQAAARAGRSTDEISLVAISKTYPTEFLRNAIDAGVTDLGENRVQEAEPKVLEVGRMAVRWHLVGHLQENKARRAINLFDLIHSLDSVSLAQRLNRLCVSEGREQLPVLVQINLGGEETKTGIAPDGLSTLLDAFATCPRLRLDGLMTLPPYFQDPEGGRPYFKRLRELRDRLKTEGRFDDRSGALSMGMSNDFEVAIEEGATIIRVGTAIFGQRG